MADAAAASSELKILVFSTETISDPGIDFAGSAHLHYSPSALVVSVPCSAGIRPAWILHALEQGFDGVFVAADGTDCAYLADCSQLTGDVTGRAQTLLQEHGHDPRRLKMAAVCSVCGESFVNHIDRFAKELVALDGKAGD